MPAVEKISDGERDVLVRKRWRAQAEYVSTHSGFYRARKLTGDLDELADLDFTDKEMLREDQHLNPPFGKATSLPSRKPYRASIAPRVRPALP